MKRVLKANVIVWAFPYEDGHDIILAAFRSRLMTSSSETITWLRLLSDAKDPMDFIPKDRRGAGKPLTLTSLSYCRETMDKVGSMSSENVEIELYQSCKWDELTCKAK